MQSFGDLPPFVEYGKVLFKSLRRATHVFQPKYDDEDPNHIRESTEEHLHHFSDQIVIVEDIKMAHINDGFIPRKLNQWLNKSKDLKRQVSDALKDRSPRYSDLKLMCDQIFVNMKDCPIEDANDKPMAFVARLHDAEHHQSSPDSDLSANEDFLQTLDVEKGETSSLKGGKHSITVRRGKEILSFPKLGSGSMFALNLKGESSQVGDRDAWEIIITEEGNQTDDISFAPVGESELGMIFPICLAGDASERVDLSLRKLSMPSSPEAYSLNNDFGLLPEIDNYVFFAERNCVEFGVVNRKSKEMPTDEEWHEAGVVNLIDKNVRLLNEEPNCPNLAILFLQRNSRLTEIPPTFFHRMPSLRLLDLSETRIKALPISLFELKKLRILLLRSCVCLDTLPAEVGSLINMEVLDLLGTDLPDLPTEIGGLTKLRHLQLSFNQPDISLCNTQPELVSSGSILQLQALQGLSIDVHPRDQQWDRVVGDVIKQIGELKMLSYLQFYFPSVDSFLNFSEMSLSWKQSKLRRFKFIVGRYIKRIISRVPEEVESKYEEYDKCLRFVNGDKEVHKVMKTMLKPVTAFYLDHHLKIKSLSEFEVSNFEELKFLVVRECPNIEVMVTIEKRNVSFFPNLEYMGLHYLWNLEKIWEDPVAAAPPPGSYQALKYLMIGTCGELKYIASHSMLQSLTNLEKFTIEDCESLTSIVKEDEMMKSDEGHLLPRLKELVLRHLPQLVALGRGLSPSKEIMRIQFCPRFEDQAKPQQD